MYSAQLEQWRKTFKRKKGVFRKIFFSLAGLAGSVPLLLLSETIQINDFVGLIVLYVLSSIAFIVFIVLGIVSPNFASKDMFLKDILPELVNDLRIEYPYIQFQGKNRDKAFHRDGRMFPKHDTVSTKYSIDLESLVLRHTTLSHSNGKTQVVDFQGVYMIFPIKTDTHIQIRSHGSPRRKPKYYLLEKNKSYRYYSETESDLLNRNFISLYESIHRLQETSRLYISLTPTAFHVAISSKQFKVPTFKQLNNSTIESLKHWLHHQIQIAMEIQEFTSYYQ